MNSIAKRNAAMAAYELLIERLRVLDDKIAVSAAGLLKEIDVSLIEQLNVLIAEKKELDTQIKEMAGCIAVLEGKLDTEREAHAQLKQMQGGPSALTQLLNEFHDMGRIYSDETPVRKFMQDRVGHFQEEIAEIDEGIRNNDAEEVFDGLIDLIYLAIGACDLLRLPLLNGFLEVHTANMKKEPCEFEEESPRGKLPDFYKPEEWEAPNLQPILLAAGFGLEFSQGDSDTIASRHALSNS